MMRFKVSHVFFAALLWTLAVEAQSPASWRSLAQTQKALGFTEYVWNGDSVCLSNESHVIRFYQGRRKAEVNDTVVLLNAAPEGSVVAGDWRIATIDLDFLELSILPRDCNAIKPLRVMLDAGHGGVDDGACSRTPAVAEKALTLDLALRVGQLLEGMGMQVLYTRTNDVAVALDARARAARKAEADAFVSIHANFASNTNACGPETYVVTPAGFPGTSEGSRSRGFQIGNVNNFHNTLLGYSIQRHLVKVDPDVPDRGLKRQSFFVLREISCPSVLVEVGFLSNEAETRKMLTTEWKDQCALAIARGVIEYARKVDTLTLAVNEKRQRNTTVAKESAKTVVEQKKPVATPPPPTQAPIVTNAVVVAEPEKREEKVKPTPTDVPPPPLSKLPEDPQSIFDYHLKD